MPPQSPRNRPISMEPIELFRNIFFDRIGGFARFCGAEVMRLDYRPSALTLFWVPMNFSYIIFSFYTFAVCDRVTMWRLLTLFALAIQGCVKFVSVISYAPVIGRNVEFLRTVYARNQRGHRTRNYAILARWSLLSWKLCRLGAVLINWTCFMLVPMTLINNHLLDEHALPLLVYVPFVDENTRVGYALLFIYHFMLKLLGGIGTCAVDLLLLMLVMQMWPMCEILAVQFSELNAAVRDDRLRHTMRMKAFFRNILLQHKEICRYIGDISDAYFYIIFTEIFTIALSLCALIFCSLTMTWYSIYFIVALMLAKLLGFCLLGTIVELTTDSILSTILNSDWYLLPLDLQRMVLRMLAVAQKPRILRAGTIAVNLDTFVKVIKSVYTVGMILIETVQ